MSKKYLILSTIIFSIGIILFIIGVILSGLKDYPFIPFIE